jgi:predicted ABC-type ATPase
MRYLALRDFASHLERVKARADAGGHSASETTLRRIYEASLRNLRRAVLEMDILWVYDNTPIDASHLLILEARNGKICFLADGVPLWSIIGSFPIADHPIPLASRSLLEARSN